MHTAQHISETESQCMKLSKQHNLLKTHKKFFKKQSLQTLKFAMLNCYCFVYLNLKNYICEIMLKSKNKNAHNLFSVKIKTYSSISLES